MKYFKKREFDCPCCGANQMDFVAMEAFDLAREFAGVPFRVSSGYRCQEYNDALKDSVPDSAHVGGYAVDVYCRTSNERYQVITGALAAGINRIGVSDGFVHLDVDPGKPKNLVWVY